MVENQTRTHEDLLKENERFRSALIECFHYAQNLDDEWVMERVRLAVPDLGAESDPDF